MPFENFAGEMLAGSEGEKVGLLKLVLGAVGATRDYSVFGKRLLKILVQYKWDEYAAQQVMKDLMFFIAHLSMTTAFVLTSSDSLDVRPAEVFEDFGHHWFLFIGWIFTTLMSLLYLWRLRDRVTSIEAIRSLDYQDYINV